MSSWGRLSTTLPPTLSGTHGLQIPPHSNRRRRVGRIVAQILCLLFAILGAIPLSAGLLLRTSFAKQWINQMTVTQLQQQLGISASFDATVRPWPLAVVAHNLVVDSTDNSGPAFRAERVELRPRVFSLLQGNVNVGEIEIDRPTIRLVIEQARIVNFELPPSSPDAAPTSEAPFSVIAVNAANLDVMLDGVSARASDVDLDVVAEPGRAFEVALRSGSILLDDTRHLEFTGYGAPAPVEARHEDLLCQLDARVRVEPAQVIVRRFRVNGAADLDPAPDTRPGCDLPADDLRQVELELRHASAAIDPEGIQSVQGKLRARAPLRIANRYLSFLRLEGWLGLDVDASWSRGSALPQLTGDVRGEGIALGIYRIARHLAGSVRIDRDVVSAPLLNVGYADGVVSIKDFQIRPLEQGIPLTAESVTLDRLQFPGLMRDLGVTDHTHVAMKIDDGLFTQVKGTIEPLRIDSDLVVHVSDFEVFDRPFDDPARAHAIGVRKGTVHMRFAVRPEAIEFQSARAEFGGSKLNVFTSLGFTDQFRLVVSKGSTVELADVSPLVDIPWSGTAELTAEITGVFNDPDIKGDISIRGFEFASMSLGDLLGAKVHFRPMVLELAEVTGRKGRSSYAVPSLRLNFEGQAAVEARGVITSTSFDLRDFLGVFGAHTDPRFEGIAGTAEAHATLHYEQGGPRDACGGGWMQVRTHARVRNAVVLGERFEQADVDLDYQWLDPAAQELGVHADIRSVVLRKGDGVIIGSGTIRPGGVIRARATATGIPLTRLQVFESAAGLIDANVAATADISGTLDRLAAEVDVRVGPLRLGTTMLPASQLRVSMFPIDPTLRVVGRTRCGQPISAPWDPLEYQRDLPLGVFVINGELLGGQVTLDNLEVTRQSRAVATGIIGATKLDLGKLAQLVPPLAAADVPPQGKLTGQLTVRHLEFDSLRNADMSLVLTQLDVSNQDGAIRLRNGTPPITLRSDDLDIPEVLLDVRSARGLSGTLVTSGKVHRVVSEPELDLTARLLPADLSALAEMVPRLDRARGIVQARVNITGKPSAPVYRGEVTLRDGAVAIRGFSAPIEDIQVDVRLSDREILLERATASMGGGTVSALGSLPIQGYDFGTATAVLRARGIALTLADGVSTSLNADLTASWNARVDEEARSIPKITGEVSLLSFDYRRPIGINADINTITQRVKRTQFEVYDPEQDMVDFDIRIRAAAPLRLRNNVADMQMTIDSDVLTLSGSNQRAGLRGALRVKPGSRLKLRANEFEVREGLVRFDDPSRIAPSIDVTAVTEYRRYTQQAQSGTTASAASASSGGAAGVSRAGGQWRIQLHAHGDAEALQLDMTSEPALSREDIILLLTFGVTRAELDQMQASSIGETAAVEALSTLTGADSAVRETIPVIDDFRFGSAYSSRSGRTEPTATVGKRVTERVRANVTSGLSESREVRSNLEWQLTGNTSVLGSYDNVNNVSNSSVGNLGADLRFRITFE